MLRTLGVALVAVALLPAWPSGGSAAPAGNRIVVGFTEQGYAGARALEDQLGAKVVARIEPLRADVLSLDDAEAGAALQLVRAAPRVRYAQTDGIVRANRVPNDECLPRQWR